MLQLLKKIVSLSFLYGVSSVSYQLVGLILLPLYTRYLTSTEFGIYALALVGIKFFEVFVNIGIPSAFFRFFYDFKDEKRRSELISTTYMFVTFTSLIMIILVLSVRERLMPIFFVDEKYYICFYFTIFLSLLESPQIIAFHYFRADEQVKKYCFFNFLRSGVLFCSAWFFLVYMEYGIFALFIARMLSSFPTYIYLTYVLISRHGIKFSYPRFREMFGYGFPFFVVNFLAVVMSSIDRPILLKYMSMSDVGIYAVAFRVASGVKFIIVNAFALGWTPMVMKIKNQPNGRELFSKLFTYYLLIAGSVVLAVSLFSKDILNVIVAPEFISAYTVIPLLCLAHLFYGIYNNLEVGIFISKKSKYYIPILGAGALTYVILNIVLIPKYGYMGAAAASALSFMIIPVGTFFVGRKLYLIRYEYMRILKVFVALFATYLIGVYVPVLQLYPSVAKNVVVLCCFPLILLVVCFFRRNELSWLKKKLISKVART